MRNKNFSGMIIKVVVFFILTSVLFLGGFSTARAGFFDQVGSYFSEGGKTIGDASGKLGGGAAQVWQNIGGGLGEAAGAVARNTAQASGAFLESIKNFNQTVGGLGSQVSKGYDAVLGKVKQGTDKLVGAVMDDSSKKENAKVVAPKPAVKNNNQKIEVKQAVVPQPAVIEAKVLPTEPTVVQKKEKNKSSASAVTPKQVVIYSNKANQESVQPLVATAVKTATSGNSIFETIKSKGDVTVGDDVSIDAATGVATFKGIKIIGTVDFTGADVKGFKQTVVNNYSSGTPMVVYNSTTKENDTWQTLSGQTGGVSNHWSIGKDLTVGNAATIGAGGLTIGTATANGALTVNGGATITGTATFSGATTLSGAATLSSSLTVNGNTTLGDAAGDTITINGRLSTLNVSDGSTTSSLANNSFYIAADSSNALGKFYVDSSGNVSASGTVTSFGGITLSGHLAPSSDNLYDVGSSSTQWRYGNFQGGLLVANGSTTSTLLNNSLTLGQASGYNVGTFYVDSSGNVSSSGSLRAYANVTSTGNIYPATAAGADLGALGIGFNNVYASSSLYVGNGANSSTFKGNYIATTDGTSSTVLNGSSLTMGSGTNYNSGMFNVDSNGKISTSGTILAANAPYSAPAFSFSSDPDTGMHNANGEAGSIYFVNNGSNSLLIGGSSISVYRSLLPTSDNNLDFGSTSVQWRTGYFQTSLIIADGSTTSTLLNNSLTLGQASGYNVGTFYVDSSGNVSSSGSLRAYANVTSTGNIYPATAAGADLGALGIGFNNVYASSSLYVGNGANSSTFKGNYIATTDGTSSTVLNGSSFTLGSGTSYNSGMFNVDSNGNVNASGTIKVSLGTAADPSIAFYSDSDTGFYRYSANTIGVTANGAVIGDFVTPSAAEFNTFRSFNGVALALSGRITDSATAVAVKIGNVGALSTAGAKILSVYSDEQSTERAFIDKDGGIGLVIATGFNNGKFNIDSSGNASASGSIKAYGNVTSTGHIYPATVAGADLGALGLGFNNVYASSSLYVGNGANSSTFKGNYIATTDGTSSTVMNGSSLTLGSGTNFNQGALAINNQGAISASGTVYIFGGAANALYGLNISVAKRTPAGPDNVTTTFTSYVMDTAGSTGFAFNTIAQGGAMSSTTAGTNMDRALMVVQNNGTNKFAISGGGNVYATAGFNANSTQYGIGDVAEYVNLAEDVTVEYGDVVVVDTNGLNQYRPSESAYAKNVAGVISNTGAFVIGASGDDRAPLALAGLVNVKVTDENGPIAVGDYLVTASKSGYAMKYDSESGKSAGLVGMALEPWTEGDGKIKILVNKGLVAGSSGGSISLNVSQNENGQLVQNGDLDMIGQSILKVKAITSASGNWSINNDGLLIAKDIKADKVQAKQFIVAKDADIKKSTVGEATIKLNEKSVEVENELVTPKVKIFVTFRANPQSFWWISKQIDGKFEVSLSQNANQDIVFDYWLVGVEEAEEENESSANQEEVVSAEVMAPAPVQETAQPLQGVGEEPAAPETVESAAAFEATADDNEKQKDKKIDEHSQNGEQVEEKNGEVNESDASNS